VTVPRPRPAPGSALWHRREGAVGWAPASATGSGRPVVGLACSEEIRQRYVDERDAERLRSTAEFRFQPFEVPSGLGGPAPRDAAAESALAEFAADLDVLLVCHGAPFVSAEILARSPRLGLLGELEGDRFGYRFDTAAVKARGLRIVDTTHGSSWPTAEWALGLALLGLRNAGVFFRRLIAHQPAFPPGSDWSRQSVHGQTELSHKRVGMIGFGHLARDLARLLGPFEVEIIAYDPYVPKELAEAYGVVFGPLEAALRNDVVFCLLPLTPLTEHLLAREQLEVLRPGSVFINVSRGRVVDSAALVARLARGDIVACLDVFDPEPVPLDCPVRDLENVFLSPHIGGMSEESRRRFFALMVDECLRYFAGLEPYDELTSSVLALRNAPKGH
jgi:phosphoglycerate dehydrogenase-like enzyme